VLLKHDGCCSCRLNVSIYSSHLPKTDSVSQNIMLT